jgi:hypothetical protein
LLKKVEGEAFFDEFLLKNRTVFHEGRTGFDIHKRWNTFRSLKLLKDQVDQLDARRNLDYSSFDNIASAPFDEIESTLDDEKIMLEVEMNKEMEIGSKLKILITFFSIKILILQ